ncbi:MAG TPA: branched-chain amino acid ABC transporter permease [Alcanivorax sp.]|nr:branched-chain amino acid ABC transporter permease [Alcanivorax sp.]
MNDLTAVAPRQNRFSWRALSPWVISAAVLLLLPVVFADNGTAFTLMNLIAINIVFALSYNMLLGQGGMLSFGHAVFYGLGSYGAMHAMNAIDEASYVGEGFWSHVPVVSMPLVGMIVGGLVALVIGWPFCRRAGTAFAMITLGLGEMVAAAGQMFPSIFGGEAGIYGNRTVGPQWFGLDMAHATGVYWFMAFWTFLAVLAIWAFTRTPLGRMSNAVRDNPDRLQFIGYPPRNIRFMVFIASGAFGGLAGGMAAVNYEIITPEALGLIPSGTVLLMTAVGGLGVFYGPIVGAVVVSLMNSMLSDYTDASILYVGLIFLAIVMFAPRGLGGGLEQVRVAAKDGSLVNRLPGWLSGALAVILISLGLILIIELLFQLLHGDDATTQFFGLEFKAVSIISWIWSLILFGAGVAVMRVTRKLREDNA